MGEDGATLMKALKQDKTRKGKQAAVATQVHSTHSTDTQFGDRQ